MAAIGVSLAAALAAATKADSHSLRNSRSGFHGEKLAGRPSAPVFAHPAANLRLPCRCSTSASSSSSSNLSATSVTLSESPSKISHEAAVAAATAAGAQEFKHIVAAREATSTSAPADEAIAFKAQRTTVGITSVNMAHSVAALILGGGESKNFPLTRYRAKPAVPIGANYRLIDITVSNCINSGVTKVYVLTQFNSLSLNSHIATAFPASAFGGFGKDKFVECVAASQGIEHKGWFQGSADAVRRFLYQFDHPDNDEDPEISEYLVLSGEQLYRMDYSALVAQHRRSKCDITVATTSVAPWHVFRLGIMKVDDDGNVVDFAEKPTSPATLKNMQSTSPRFVSPDKPFCASMGIYCFKRDVLRDLLQKHPDDVDFGRHVMARAIKQGYKIRAHHHAGYWNDVSTLEHFYHANLDQAKVSPPPFDFHDRDFPIYTSPRHLPPAIIENCKLESTLVGDGCVVRAKSVAGCVLGLCSHISPGVVLEDTLMCGADYLQSAEEREALLARGEIPVGIGENTYIKGAILDKNARIGRNVRISNVTGVADLNCEEKGYVISSGIVTILKDAVIPDNTEI